METPTNWKTRTMIVGAILGSLAGLAAAYVLISRAEQENKEQAKLTAGDGVKVGLGLLGILRLLANTSDKH
ncbi:MAG TPA: hypothetical protein PKG95_13830 [Anaerolineaceae bacterium]|jgi:hypothetical protein|nr:hypothetical protein [Anaerolineaceae bacterium]